MAKSDSHPNANPIKELLNGHVTMPETKTLRLIAFCVLLIFIYITNNLDSERQKKQISELTAQVKELHYQQISTQSDLMNMSKQSEVLRRVKAEELGLEELTEPPRIIKR